MKWEQLSEKLEYNDLSDLPSQYHQIVKKYIDNGDYIYRGMRDSGSFVIGDGSNSERRSRNTTNIYTLLIDEFMPAWKPYPKRSKSFICSTSHNVANGYGSVYFVIPLEGQQIGICPSKDFWFGFDGVRSQYGTQSLARFNETLVEFYNVIVDKSYTITKDGLKSMLSDIEQYVSKTSVKEFSEMCADFDDQYYVTNMKKMFSSFKEHGVWESLNLAFDPSYNGFELAYDTKRAYEDNEVWLSGKVLFIRYNAFKEILNYGIPTGE